MGKKLLIGMSIVISCFLVGCKQQDNITTQKETIKVGLIAPLSGPGSTYGEDTVNAVNIVINEFNQQSKNKKIELIIEDGKCNGADATSAAQKLINIDNVAILLGGVCSSEAVAVGKIAQENNIVDLVGASQSPNISTIGKYVFRYANGISAANMIGDLIQKHFKNIILVSENTEFGQSIAAVVRQKVGKNIISDIKYESNEKDFNLIAQKVKLDLQQADAIITLPQSESSVTNVIKAFEKEGIRQSFSGVILGYPFLTSPSFLKNVGNTANGLYNVNLGPSLIEGTTAKKYYDILEQTHGVKSILYGRSLAMESAKAITDAIASGSTSREDFYNYFSSFTKENPKTGFLIPSYYFSGSDAIGVPYFLEKVENGKAKQIDTFQ